MLNKALIEKIEERYGKKLVYSTDVESLCEHIFETTKERLGVSTLKRMFGFVGQKVEPRTSSMDIIAQYCGYPNYELMAKDMGEDTEISDFSPVDEVVANEIPEGTMIQVSYEPARILVLTYIGNGWFIVNESQKSKLIKGDKIRASHLTKGFKLLASDVMREGRSLGPYTAAKEGGLTSVEIIN